MHMHLPRPNAVHVANADRGREEETSDMQKPNKNYYKYKIDATDQLENKHP